MEDDARPARSDLTVQPTQPPEEVDLATDGQRSLPGMGGVFSVEMQGPLPPPSILAGYERVIPGAAAQILEMAKAEQLHRHALEAEQQRAEVAEAKRDSELAGFDAERYDSRHRLGQWWGAIIAAACVVGAIASAFLGAGALQVAAFLSLPVIGIVRAVRQSFEPSAKSKPESEQDDPG